MNDLDVFLELYGLAAIFILMLVKSAGVPIPVPADAVMLATSVRAAEGKLVLSQAFAAILVALVIGGVIQFMLARGPGRRFLYRFGRYLGMTPARLDSAAERLKKGGPVAIGLAILTPGVRSVAVVGCGLAGIPLSRFVPGLILGSALFLGLHFFLGYAGGLLLSTVQQVIPPPALIAIIVGLLVVGFGAWYVIRRRQLPDASNGDVLAEALGAWHEATCPVCLALGAAERLQIHAHTHHEGGHRHGDHV
jgi:membrane protein DedA with SNARE-associated domain